MRTFDWVEVLWTALTFGALLVHSIVWWDGVQDIRLMQELGHRGRRWIVARANLRRESIRTGIQILLCLVGIIALATPPPVTKSSRGVVFVTIFLSVSVLLLLNSVFDFRERGVLRRYGDTHTRKPPEDERQDGG